MFYRKDFDKADYIFGKYSKMLRATVLNSDKIITTLAEELDYTKNFIELEKIRQNNKFIYEINIDENADLNLKVPKMIIYTFVENAIKHGIRHLKKDGLLKILIKRQKDFYEFIISDNGVGRKKAENIEIETTGKGLGILDRILELDYKLTGRKITYGIIDKTDKKGRPDGTEINVKVFLG